MVPCFSRFKGPVLAILAFCLALPLFGAEYEDGFIRLVLNPVLGRFSLYYLTEPERQKYEALFMDQDPRTSVLSLSYDNRIYRLGESEEFKVSEGGSVDKPTLIFESSSLTVTEEFSFISTGGSEAANGIKVNFIIENKGRRRVRAGLRLLLDTKLGESTATPFRTSDRDIQEEMIFAAAGPDRYWISGAAEGPSLMGSISAVVDRVPDSVHIANWKRLNDVPWSLDLVQGRKFNNPPYSIRDSAVAYFYEPVQINREESVSFFLLLASADRGGFSSVKPSEGLPVSLIEERPVFPEIQIDEPGADQIAAGPELGPEPEARNIPPPPNTNPAIIRSDYYALQDIISRVEGYLQLGARMSDDELASIEQDLARIRSRYAEPGAP
jgi:hypothetical protein